VSVTPTTEDARVGVPANSDLHYPVKRRAHDGQRGQRKRAVGRDL